MSLAVILVLGLGLSMDAFAVSICKGLALRHVDWKDMLCAGLWFGDFQGLMPLIGYLFGSLFSGYMESFSSWIAFGLLAWIGGSMIKESMGHDQEEEASNASMKPAAMLVLAIATSIDALAVGVTFSAVPVAMFAGMSRLLNTIFACLLITLETGVLSAAGIKIGAVFGDRYQSKAELFGGIVLILIGLKILLGHYGIL